MEGHSRRSLLWAAGGATLLGACGGSERSVRRPGVSRQDLALLGDALAFERLEAAFYAQAARQGGPAVLRELAAQERAHARTLERAIRDAGGRPPASGRLALRLPEADGIPRLARRIEEQHAAALLALVPRIANAGLLATALSIHAVEARHVVALRELEGTAPAPAEALGEPVALAEALERVRGWLA